VRSCEMGRARAAGMSSSAHTRALELACQCAPMGMRKGGGSPPLGRSMGGLWAVSATSRWLPEAWRLKVRYQDVDAPSHVRPDATPLPAALCPRAAPQQQTRPRKHDDPPPTTGAAHQLVAARSPPEDLGWLHAIAQSSPPAHLLVVRAGVCVSCACAALCPGVHARACSMY
jgi:hypothetical protein